MTDPSPPNIRAAENFSLTSLILSIVSMILAIPFGILAALVTIPGIICGHIAIKKYRFSGTMEERGMAKAGIVIGWIALVISILVSLVMWYFAQQMIEDMQSILDQVPLDTP